MDAPPVVPRSSVIVVKGVPQKQDTMRSGAGGHRLHGEWALIVSRVDGSIQRFVADGVDLIEPGTGM